MDAQGSGALEKPAKQARSREKLARVIAAAQRLSRDRPLEDISVAEIAAESGVAVGTIYQRFRDKAALIERVHRDYFEASARREAALLEELATIPDLDGRVELLVDHLMADYRENAGVLRSIIVAWRVPERSVVGTPTHRAVIATYRQLARTIAADQPVSERRVLYGLHTASNLCRDLYLFPQLLADHTVRGWRSELRDVLLAAFHGVLAAR